MFFSKHHYAIELAKRDNKVYFLNPPSRSQAEKKTVKIENSGWHENLSIITHYLTFPYSLKFHFVWLFHFFIKYHLRRILKLIPEPIDVVWSFDLGNLYPFSFFPRGAFKLFHPVDEPLNKPAIASANGAEVMFSVTHEILRKYDHFRIPKHFINHGLAANFLTPSTHVSSNESTVVGFSGNLLRADIDRETFLQIVRDNHSVSFECWGIYAIENQDYGEIIDQETQQFINSLQKCGNVVLHGAVSPDVLAREFQRMDAFLICYDISKDQSKGTNYHKIMEYLSTGKVIISNNVTTYNDKPQLVQMISGRNNNKLLPELFRQVIENLTLYNSSEAQRLRTSFAAENTYASQIERIEKILVEL